MKESGSQQTYLREFRDEQARQLDWQRKALRQEVRTLRKGGEATASSMTAGAVGSAVQGVASAGQWWMSR